MDEKRPSCYVSYSNSAFIIYYKYKKAQFTIFTTK